MNTHITPERIDELWNFLIVPVYRNARKAQKKGQP
jgi:hypothetical protein